MPGAAYGRLRSVIGVSILDVQLFREPGDGTCGQWRFAINEVAVFIYGHLSELTL